MAFLCVIEPIECGVLVIFIINVGSPHIETPREMWWGSDFIPRGGHHRVGFPTVGESLKKILPPILPPQG